jgi:type II secretory pathway pseudopilin PulG
VTVWAIIAILVAILFPVFARAREKARQTNCLSNLKNIGTGLRIYAVENYGHLPPNDNDVSALFPKTLADAGVLECLSVRDRRLLPYPPVTPLANGPQDDRVIDGPPQPLYPPPELPSPDVAIPSSGLTFDYVYRGGLCDDDLPNQAIMADDIAHRHNGGANYLMLSGSVKWYKDVFTSQGQMSLPEVDGMWRLHELRAVKAGQPLPKKPPPYNGGAGEDARKALKGGADR